MFDPSFVGCLSNSSLHDDPEEHGFGTEGEDGPLGQSNADPIDPVGHNSAAHHRPHFALLRTSKAGQKGETQRIHDERWNWGKGFLLLSEWEIFGKIH